MPMTGSQIKALIKQALPDADITVSPLADDGDHYAAEVASRAFEGLTRLQQHQLVYTALRGRLGGELHALQLKTSVLHRS